MKHSNAFFPLFIVLITAHLAACSSNEESSEVVNPGQDAGSDVQTDSSLEAAPGDDASPADATTEWSSEAAVEASWEAEADSSSETGSDGALPGEDAAPDGPKPQCGAYQAVSDWPTAGYLMHFTAAGEHAHALVTSGAGVAHISTWLADTTTSLGIPGGPIELSSQYNPGYSYRLVPDQISFGDMWIELCDAAPCYIEENDPAVWLASPTSWCPWGFAIVDVWDCRANTAGNACPKVYP